MRQRYRWRSPQGEIGPRLATLEDAVQSALLRAYGRPFGVRVTYGVDLAFQLWKSLQSKGWRIEAAPQ